MALLKTQGTALYLIDGMTVHKLDKVASVSLGSDSSGKIDVTSLEETVSKKYLSGLSDPAEMTFSFMLDSENPAHKKILEFANSKKEGLIFVLGANDGTADPTSAVTAGTTKVTLPTSRTFWKFTGSVASASLNVESDNVVKYDVSVTRSSIVEAQFKSA